VRFGATVLLRQIRRVTLSSDSDDVGTVLLCSVMDDLTLNSLRRALYRSNDWRLQVDAIARQLEVPSPRLQPAEQFAMMAPSAEAQYDGVSARRGLSVIKALPCRGRIAVRSTLGADSVGRNAMPSRRPSWWEIQTTKNLVQSTV
jgi:hypothetical protein